MIRKILILSGIVLIIILCTSFAYIFNTIQNGGSYTSIIYGQLEDKINRKPFPSYITKERKKSMGMDNVDWNNDKDKQFRDIIGYPSGYTRKMLDHVNKMPKRYFKDPLSKNSKIQSSLWTQRGPKNVGGRTRALAIDISDESRILAGGISGGMWLSENDGRAWTKTTKPGQIHIVSSVVQDVRPGKTHIWYCGTGEYHGSSWYGNGIYKSIDGGNSWQLLSNTSSTVPGFDQCFDCVWKVITNPNNTEQDEVLAACYSGIMRSIDGGENWEKVIGTDGLFDMENLIFFPYSDILITDENVYFAAIGSPFSTNWSAGHFEGLFRSIDGINWTKVSPADWVEGTHKRIVLANSEAAPDEVYFLSNSPEYGVNDHSLFKYTYLSGDGSGDGGNWTDLSQNLPTSENSDIKFHSHDGYDLVIAVAPHNKDIVLIGGVHLYISTNGFNSDSETNIISNSSHIYHHVDQHVIFFKPSDPDWLYNANDGGVWRNNRYLYSSAKTFWENLNFGYTTSQFYNVAIDHSAYDDKIIIGGTQDNGTLFTKFDTFQGVWDMINGGDGIICAIADNKEYYYVSHNSGFIYRLKLSPYGEIESGNYFGPGDDTIGRYGCFRMTLDPNNSNRMFMTTFDYLWRNNNLSSIPVSNEISKFNWKKLINTKVENDYIFAIGISKEPANILYYGTSNGLLFRLDNAFEGDPIPVDIGSNKGFPEDRGIRCVAVDPKNGHDVLVVFENFGSESLYHSTDGGTTFTDISGNLAVVHDGRGYGPKCYWAEIMNISDENIYFIGTTAGLFSTTSLNGFDTVWKQEGPETIGCVPVMMIDSRSTDGFVVVATHGNGVYSANFTEISTNVENKNLPLPVKFELKQNYPNPFNAGTTIGFTLPEYSTVKVAVYNLIGQEVRTLLTSNMPSGSHKVRWDGRDNFGRAVSSGTYIYRIIAGNKVESKKMVLIK